MTECIRFTVDWKKNFNAKRNLPELYLAPRMVTDGFFFFFFNSATYEKSLSIPMNRVSISFGKHLMFDIHTGFVCPGIGLVSSLMFIILCRVE